MREGIVRIHIDGRWELQEFGVFSRQYTQCYSLFYSLAQDFDEKEQAVRGFEVDYTHFPWRGGYSVVNFYNHLYSRIPPDERPEVKRIAYASPGYVDLSLVVEVALQVGALITVTAMSFNRLNDLYKNIQKGIHDRKLGRMEVEARELELDRDKLAFINDSISQLTRYMQLSDEFVAKLESRTDANKLVQLKVLQSLYRRVKPLAELMQEGMLDVEARDDS